MKKIKKTVLVGFLSLATVVCAGAGIQAMAPVSASASTPSSVFYLKDGAAILKSSSDNTGLRFRTLLKQSAYDEFKAAYQDITIGMIMLPTDTLPDEGFTVANLNAANTVYYNQTYSELGLLTEDSGEKYYHYSLAIYDLKDDNYARDMSAISYIKIPTSSVGDVDSLTIGGESFALSKEGDYTYIYTDYSEEKNARSMYEVACLAYQDGNEDIEHYIDSVASVKETDGKLEIVNDLEGYTSPYELIEETDGDYVIRNTSGVTKELKCLVVNGEVEKNYPAGLQSGKSLTVVQKSANAVLTGTSQIAMPTDYLQTKAQSSIDNMTMEYVAFDGKYDVGTYLSVTFTGANAPYVMFFANNINGKLGNKYDTTTGTHATDDKGVLFSSGVCYLSWDASGQSKVSLTDTGVYGPYKMDRGIDGAVQSSTSNNWFDPVGLSNKTKNNDTSTYTMVIGTAWINGVLNVVENVYKVSPAGVTPINGSNQKPKYNWVCSNTTAIGDADGITEGDISAGSIILYAPLSGNAGAQGQGEVSFTYTMPQTGVFEPDGTVKGTAPAADGTVTLNSEPYFAEGATWNKWGCGTNRYTAYMGNYGVGTYMDFEFTGKNLPQVMLFGSVQEGDTDGIGMFSTYGAGSVATVNTNYNRKGVLVMNTAANSGTIESGLQVYGPDRLIRTETGENNPKTGAGAIATGSALGFNHYNLSDDVTYKYTIGTYLSNGVVMLDVSLTNLTTNETITDTIALTGIDKAMTGYICFHLPFTYTNNDSNITYKVSLPYTK